MPLAVRRASVLHSALASLALVVFLPHSQALPSQSQSQPQSQSQSQPPSQLSPIQPSHRISRESRDLDVHNLPLRILPDDVHDVPVQASTRNTLPRQLKRRKSRRSLRSPPDLPDPAGEEIPPRVPVDPDTEGGDSPLPLVDPRSASSDSALSIGSHAGSFRRRLEPGGSSDVAFVDSSDTSFVDSRAVESSDSTDAGSDSDSAPRAVESSDSTLSLFSGDFADCLDGESLFNVTNFDAAITTSRSLFLHMRGSTNLDHEEIMLYLTLAIHNQDYLTLALDPCAHNMSQLCPLQAIQPIDTSVLVPLDENVGHGSTTTLFQQIPALAFRTPDLGGSFRMQLLSNASQTVIGCFQSSLKNHHTVSRPRVIGPILGTLTLLTMLTSFFVAVDGQTPAAIRRRHARILPAFLLLEAFQSMFFLGALSVDFPAILPAWWSNLAWSAGLIPLRSLVRSLHTFLGIDGKVVGHAGGAGSRTVNPNGGLLRQIYGRALPLTRDAVSQSVNALSSPAASQFGTHAALPLSKRSAWGGSPVGSGLPIPGSWSGFSGTLSSVGIPVDAAMIIGTIWVAIFAVAAAVAVFAVYWLVWGVCRTNLFSASTKNRLSFFLAHPVRNPLLALMRTLYLFAFPLLCLTLFQLSSDGRSAVKWIAGIVFVAVLVVVGGVVLYACYSRLRYCKLSTGWKSVTLPWPSAGVRQTNASGVHDQPQADKSDGCPDDGLTNVNNPSTHESNDQSSNESKNAPNNSRNGGHPNESKTDSGNTDSPHRTIHTDSPRRTRVSVPICRLRYETDHTPEHRDNAFLARFGWLAGPFRQSFWWYFAPWFVYHIIRACFVGGLATHPAIQVYGLLTLEILFFLHLVVYRPMEGLRNTLLGTWLLGPAKILTTGLCATFLTAEGSQSVDEISSALADDPTPPTKAGLVGTDALQMGIGIVSIQVVVMAAMVLGMLTSIWSAYVTWSEDAQTPSTLSSAHSHPHRSRLHPYHSLRTVHRRLAAWYLRRLDPDVERADMQTEEKSSWKALFEAPAKSTPARPEDPSWSASRDDFHGEFASAFSQEAIQSGLSRPKRSRKRRDRLPGRVFQAAPAIVVTDASDSRLSPSGTYAEQDIAQWDSQVRRGKPRVRSPRVHAPRSRSLHSDRRGQSPLLLLPPTLEERPSEEQRAEDAWEIRHLASTTAATSVSESRT